MERNKSLFTVLFAAESLFLVYMALQPGYAVPTFHMPFLRGGDLEHFLAYLIYGFLAFRTFGQRLAGRRLALAALGWCMLFAGFTEGLQAFVPTRFADPADWVVDVMGSGVGILLTRLGMPAKK
jgi:VanZ family protein